MHVTYCMSSEILRRRNIIVAKIDDNKFKLNRPELNIMGKQPV